MLCDVFQEDVEAWLAKEKMSPEEGVAVLEERYKKYKYVEASMTSQKARCSAVRVFMVAVFNGCVWVSPETTLCGRRG